MPYPPEAIAAAIRNAGAHFGSRWRIVPLWILKVSEENPMLPRVYLAAFGAVTAIMIVWSIVVPMLPHSPAVTPPARPL